MSQTGPTLGVGPFVYPPRSIVPNLATQHSCPHCASTDVTVRILGLPTDSLFRYVAAHEAFSFAITRASLDAEGIWMDDEELAAWFNPEEGCGYIAPGNMYLLEGCIISDFERSLPTLWCRSCGEQSFTSEDDADNDYEDE
jgi:hypothetical protein